MESKLTGHRLHLHFALAICEEEQLVSVRNINFCLDIGPCAPMYARIDDTGIAIRILRHTLLVGSPELSVLGVRDGSRGES
jgi:hypothetical protein